MPELVLALDPGERVGWAPSMLGPNLDAPYLGVDVDSLVHGITGQSDLSFALLETPKVYDRYVIEEWQLFQGSAEHFIGSTFIPVQFIGACKLVARDRGIRVTMQSPRKKKVIDAVLKDRAPDIYELVTRPVKHDDGHDQDAIRHLFYYAFQEATHEHQNKPH